MKTILIIIIIIECLALAALAYTKKLTKKAFIIISTVTAVLCACLAFTGNGRKKPAVSEDQRAHIYMAAKLIDSGHPEAALEAVSDVTDEAGKEFESRLIRGLTYNLNSTFRTAENYLNAGENSELEQKVLDASANNEAVEKSVQKQAVEQVLGAVGATEDEVKRWDAEMKAQFTNYHVGDDERESVISIPSRVRMLLQEHRYEDAYRYITETADESDIRSAVIITNMFVNNYNNRIMTDTDAEYQQLWEELSAARAELNTVSAGYSEELATDEEKDAYSVAEAKYNLASDALHEESVKRAINYLSSIDAGGSFYELGYELQLAKLYYLSNQYDEAKTHLHKVFVSSDLNGTGWLKRDISDYREAYLRHMSEQADTEHEILFTNLMNSLYQSVFDENHYFFGEFVGEYLDEVFGGVIIKRIRTKDFPVVHMDVAVTDSELELTDKNIIIHDNDREVKEVTVEESEITDISLSLVLDRSGSMQGNSMAESKRALRNCVSKMGDSVSYSFVSFASTSRLECSLTHSQYLVSSIVDSMQAYGGTNIADGLMTGISSLLSADGTRYIILLSDGIDSPESKVMMEDVIGNAVANNIVVYTIGLVGCDAEYLQSIAARTGGQFIMASDTSKLDSIYTDLQNAMRTSYTISYTTEGEEENRSVRLESRDSEMIVLKQYSRSNKKTEDTETEETQVANYFKQISGTGTGR